MDWASLYPAFSRTSPTHLDNGRVGNRSSLIKDVSIVDIGCGFGGLLVALAPKLSDELMLGMSLRL